MLTNPMRSFFTFKNVIENFAFYQLSQRFSEPFFRELELAGPAQAPRKCRENLKPPPG